MKYIVRRGDTMHGIARAHKLKIDGVALWHQNPQLKPKSPYPDLIYPGQVVFLTPPTREEELEDKGIKPVYKTEPIIKIRGKEYAQITSLSFQKSIGAIASAVNISLKYYDEDIKAGEPVVVSAQKRCLLMGYIDQIDRTLSKDGVGVGIVCRSKTRDIVDCSSPIPRTTINKRTLKQIATQLCDPYSVNVKGVEGDVVNQFKIDVSDTIFAALEKEARNQKIILTDDCQGNLILVQSHDGYLAEELNEQILEANYTEKTQDIFSRYEVFSQGQKKRKIRGIYNTGNENFRVKKLTSEEASDNASATKRARWESDTRQANSKTYGLKLKTWGKDDLFLPNKIVKLNYQGIKGEFLIKSISFNLSGSGLTSSLELVDIKSYYEN